jgi:DNA-binding response OmpR family regulator
VMRMISSASPPESERPARASAPAASDRLASGARSRPPRALVVEDAEDSRELFACELERAGFIVAWASDGESALAQAREFEPDLIVLDLMLPGLNGFTVARAVRSSKEHRDVAILAVTALTSDAMRRMALDAGCDVVLCKPVVASNVVDEAHLLIDSRRNDKSSEGGQH